MDRAISFTTLRGLLAAIGIGPFAFLYRSGEATHTQSAGSRRESLEEREREAEALMKAHP